MEQKLYEDAKVDQKKKKDTQIGEQSNDLLVKLNRMKSLVDERKSE